MIVRKVEGRVFLIRQPDHARQCRELAEKWRPELLGFALDPAILEAVLEHDNGWAEWDARSPLNSDTGLPYQFFQMPVTEHLEIFGRGVERAAAFDPYVGLIVSMHGVGLYNGRYGLVPAFGVRHLDEREQAEADNFIQRQEQIQQELKARVADDPRYRDLSSKKVIWDVYLTLQIWDWLSLACLTGPLTPVKIGPLPESSSIEEIAFEPQGSGGITLDPYPFVEDRVITSVPLVRLGKARYDLQEDLNDELASSQTEEIAFEMVAKRVA